MDWCFGYNLTLGLLFYLAGSLLFLFFFGSCVHTLTYWVCKQQKRRNSDDFCLWSWQYGVVGMCGLAFVRLSRYWCRYVGEKQPERKHYTYAQKDWWLELIQKRNECPKWVMECGKWILYSTEYSAASTHRVRIQTRDLKLGFSVVCQAICNCSSRLLKLFCTTERAKELRTQDGVNLLDGILVCVGGLSVCCKTLFLGTNKKPKGFYLKFWICLNSHQTPQQKLGKAESRLLKINNHWWR